ncbi:hypothetical protein [Sporosarcina obsidiansis]|uniref:hypothetical protein n=1 Tax=Sporosarcina obsidiansis TaxID=2660748 RepID=UPI00129B28F0|nr:hypothetical protein [Sporosarcina obsidiansis]
MTVNEYEEFQKLIGMGEELNFYYRGDEYWISHTPGKSYLTRSEDSYSQEFSSHEQLFERGMIDRIHLYDLLNELVWQT